MKMRKTNSTQKYCLILDKVEIQCRFDSIGTQLLFALLTFKSNYNNMNSQLIDPYSNEFFHHTFLSAQNIEREVSQIDKITNDRQKKYYSCLNSFKSYVERQNKLLEKNEKHCTQRNKWYRQEISNSWKSAISNRPLILRSLARTNVIKRDADQWLSNIEQEVFEGSPRGSPSQPRNSEAERESLAGSQLIGKYNEILNEYKSRI